MSRAHASDRLRWLLAKYQYTGLHSWPDEPGQVIPATSLPQWFDANNSFITHPLPICSLSTTCLLLSSVSSVFDSIIRQSILSGNDRYETSLPPPHPAQLPTIVSPQQPPQQLSHTISSLRGFGPRGPLSMTDRLPSRLLSVISPTFTSFS